MPDGITIGPLKIYFYGIIIMFGVLAAVWVAIKEAERRELDSENVWDIVPWLLILGIVGARLWHVFTPSQSMGVGPEYYFSHPLEILNTRNGGLGIPGAVIGGLLALLIYTKRKGFKFPDLGGYHCARIGFGAGHWPLGQFLQPGAVRPAFRSALGHLY